MLREGGQSLEHLPPDSFSPSSQVALEQALFFLQVTWMGFCSLHSDWPDAWLFCVQAIYNQIEGKELPWNKK